ncbi:hypothetical protein SJAV_15540 [Sulfurisphaera javensis]|uniref:Uncharacterized protein n=1 Tax=Sulfurisphaera javensis TaxID=2049879 RepID=A0AAT9GS17_9CREN
MKSLLSIIEEYAEGTLLHYGNILKGIVIGGEAIDSLDEEKPLLVLVVLDKTHKISFYARQEIAEYFTKKIEPTDVYFEYVKKYGHRPLLYFIVIDPTEIEFHNPIILYLLSKGKILFDREKIIENERKKINAQIVSGVVKIADINKGEVIEV